jgi:hypothetical protein
MNRVSPEPHRFELPIFVDNDLQKAWRADRTAMGPMTRLLSRFIGTAHLVEESVVPSPDAFGGHGETSLLKGGDMVRNKGHEDNIRGSGTS